MVLVIGDAIGLAAAGFLAVAALVRQRPIGVPAAVVGLAIVLGALGQVWAIAVLQSRMPTRPRVSPWSRHFVRTNFKSAPRAREFFGNLSPRVRWPLLAVVGAGWLLAMTAAVSGPFMTKGGPAGGRPGCPYALENHGAVTCVSRVEYERAGAALQRFAAGITMTFYGLHLGVAASAISVRRSAARTSPSL